MINVFKKIAAGAYYNVLKQGNSKFEAFFAAKMAIGASLILSLLSLSFILSLLGLKIPIPNKYVPIAILVIVIFLIPIKRAELDKVIQSNDEPYIVECVWYFWIGVFGLPTLLFMVLVILKIMGKI
jgi:TctA family transporter